MLVSSDAKSSQVKTLGQSLLPRIPAGYPDTRWIRRELADCRLSEDVKKPHTVAVIGAIPQLDGLLMLSYKSQTTTSERGVEGVVEAYMGSMLTGSPLGDAKSLSSDRRLGSAELSDAAPVIFVVDPDGAMRQSLERLLRCEGWQAETFASAEEFLSRPVELTPGCLILDVSLPGLSGLELQKHAAAKCSHIPTVFLSANEDIPTTVEAMKAGAIEFLLKPFQPEGLLGAIREGLEKSRLVVAREKQKRAIQKCYTSLSLRERQVMALVSYGLLNKQVGCELGISETTVKAHRGQVMRKMQASCLVDLVRMAGRLGMSKAREATMLRNHVDHAAWSGGQQPVGSYLFAQ